MNKIFAIAALFVALSLPAAAQEVCGAYYRLVPDENFEPLVLSLPNTSPFNQKDGPRLVINTLGTHSIVPWQGLACDRVELPAGSEIVVDAGTAEDYKFLESWVWTIRMDGYATTRLR